MTPITTGERLARIETTLDFAKAQSEQNGTRSEEILQLVLAKIDKLDEKIETRFNKIEEHAKQDSGELQALKNKGAGILAALGIFATAAATIFADFFSRINDTIFG